MRMRTNYLIWLTLVVVLASPLAAVAAEKAATLKVGCAPGVTVRLDGLEAGVCFDDGSGLLIGGVKAGTHVLRLSAEGFVDKVLRVQVEEGKSMAVVVGELEPEPEPPAATAKPAEKPKKKVRRRRVMHAKARASERSTGANDSVSDSSKDTGADPAEESAAAPSGDTSATVAEAPASEKANAETEEKPVRKRQIQRRSPNAPGIGKGATRGDPEAEPRTTVRFQARGASKAQGRTISFFYLPEGGGEPKNIMHCQAGPFFQLANVESLAPGTHRYRVRFVHETGAGEAKKVEFSHEVDLEIVAEGKNAYTVDAIFGGDQVELCRAEATHHAVD